MFQTTAPDYSGLVARLAERNGYRVLEEADALEFALSEGDCLLVCLDDMQQYPESWDVAVVLSDVLHSADYAPRVGLAGAAATRILKPRYGFNRYPALVFLRDGGYVGAIEGMRDWQAFVREVTEMKTRPISRAPGIGIPVSATGTQACH